MATRSLLSLSPKDNGNDVTVQVQINRKWAFKGANDNGPILDIDMVLTDNEGSAIYAEIPADLAEEKGALLDTYKVYNVSRFRIAPRKSNYMPVTAPFMIFVTRYTKIELCSNPPDTFPTYIYHLIPYKDIDPYDLSKTKQFHDVLGVITEISEIKSVRRINQDNTSIYRDIIIKDLSDCTMKVTLWGNRATEFSIASVYDPQRQNPIVTLFVACLPKQFKGEVYLTGGEACHWYFNPIIDEAKPYYDSSLSQKINLHLPPTSTQEIIYVPPEREHKTLKELMDMDPYDLSREKGCLCTVTISEICQDTDWWFPACPKCATRTTIISTGYQCKQCHTLGHTLRYKLSFIARDPTAEAKMFCFDAVARNIIGKPCESMVASVTKHSHICPDLAAIVSLKFTFMVIFNERSFQGTEKVLLVKSTVEAHGRENTLPGTEGLQESQMPCTPIKSPPLGISPNSPSVTMSRLTTNTSPKISSRMLTYSSTPANQSESQPKERNNNANKEECSQLQSPPKRPKYQNPKDDQKDIDN